MDEKMVKATEMAGNIVAHDMSLLSLIAHADMVVKITMLLLILASFWSWAIIFDKLLLVKKLKRKNAEFERTFWSGQLLEHLYERVKNTVDSPMVSVFVSAMFEWTRRKNFKTTPDSMMKLGIKDRIYQSMQAVKNREIEKLEKSLNFLATVGSSAPFVGLFGTVWGIMHSFQSIAATKNTTLAVVAPGIAEALLATAVGLFAAIPAVIFYNLLAKEINNFDSKLDDFSYELGLLLTREIDEGEK